MRFRCVGGCGLILPSTTNHVGTAALGRPAAQTYRAAASSRITDRQGHGFSRAVKATKRDGLSPLTTPASPQRAPPNALSLCGGHARPEQATPPDFTYPAVPQPSSLQRFPIRHRP